MSLPSPNLDDRDFAALLAEATARVRQSCPAWTNLTPGDPGVALLEAFAHLTEVMLYRLNRLPQKAFVEYLKLMGVGLHPPAAARADLTFTLLRADGPPVDVPRGTRVTTAGAGGADAPVFVTAEAVRVEAGRPATVAAYHCEWVAGEPAGVGSGLPGQAVAVARPPVVAPTGDPFDLVVGVERGPDEPADATAWEWNGKAYRLWREVPGFGSAEAGAAAYVADRHAGRIGFAPAVRRTTADGLGEPATLALVPASGRPIRLWYRRGGGPNGNVPAGSLTVFKDAVPGVAVTNPAAASGGRAAETLDNALVRGPLELHATHLVVTAADYERAAVAAGAARARAYTKRQVWVHAAPGTVEVRMVPDLPAGERGTATTPERLRACQAEGVRQAVADSLDARRPLGTACEVGWVRYKPVRVAARLVTHRGADAAAVRARVAARLSAVLSPLAAGGAGGWEFGRAVRASRIYDLLLEEPGVAYADRLRFVVGEVPDAGVTAVEADPFQPRVWYAGGGEVLYRTVNDADGWEVAARFPGEEVRLLATFPGRRDLPGSGRPGLLAVGTGKPGGTGSTRFRVSRDCGESWDADTDWRATGFPVNGLCWSVRGGDPVLLLASDAGLFALGRGADPLQVAVDPAAPTVGFYAVAAAATARGTMAVAAAATGKGGVYVAGDAGGPFKHTGLRGEDVRVLRAEADGPRTYLWAGSFAEGQVAGTGAARAEVFGDGLSPEGWRRFQTGWAGGSCRGLAFQRSKVLAATSRAGVLALDRGTPNPAWVQPDFAACGWPVRGPGELERVAGVAADPDARLLLAAGPKGVYRSRTAGATFDNCSRAEFADRVTLPEAWLFCPGEHDLTVVGEDELDAD